MKKLIKVSLVAMLVATPMVASAASVPVAYVNANGVGTTTTKPDAVTANTHVATTSYVQGAYNELAEAINTVSNSATNAADAAFTASAGNANSAALNGATTIGAAINNVASATDSNTAAIGTISGFATAMGEGVDTVGEAVLNLDGRVDTLEGQMGNTALSNVTGLTNTNVTGAIVELQNDKLETSKATVATLQSGSYNAISAGDDVGANLEALDTAIGNIQSNSGSLAADGHYILKDNTVAQNLSALDGQVYTNTGDLTTLKGAVGTSGSVLNSIQGNAAAATFNKTGSQTSLGSTATIQGALDSVGTAVDTNTTNIGTINTTIGSETMTTTATSLKGAINELDAKVLSVWGTWGSANSTGEAALMDPTVAGTGSNPATSGS